MISLQVYPASKMSAFLMAGLSSKNAKQRAECLDELCHLIRGFGSSVLQPTVPQNLKEIAKQISDRDNGVRNAALNCVAETYFQDGDKLYKVIGNLKDKDMAMLEERIKRQAKTRPLPGCGPVQQQQQQQTQQAPAREEAAPRRQASEDAAPAGNSRLPGASRINSATMTRPRPSAMTTAGGVPSDGPPPPTRQHGFTPGKARPVSGAFTLDLDKIESAVDNIGDSGLRLVNHKLEDIFNDEPVRLPQTITGLRTHQHNNLPSNNRQQFSPPSAGEQLANKSSPPHTNGRSHESRNLTEMPEAYEALDLVLAQIFNQDTQTCISALAQLDELLKDQEKVQLIGQRMDQVSEPQNFF